LFLFGSRGTLYLEGSDSIGNRKIEEPKRGKPDTEEAIMRTKKDKTGHVVLPARDGNGYPKPEYLMGFTR
jgi:hypothetical protein